MTESKGPEGSTAGDQPVDGGLDEPTDLEPDQGALALATEQDRATRQDWESAAAVVLRKARRLADDDPDDLVWSRLAHTTLDDIVVTPLGTADLTAEGLSPVRPTRSGAWDVRVRSTGDNEVALADLETGATSLWLLADGVEITKALAGVLTDVAPVVLEGATLEQARELTGLAGSGGLHPDTNLGATRDEDLVPFAELAAEAGIRAVVVDGIGVHERGASDGQELGWVLARGADVVRRLAEAGVDDPFALVELRVAATDEQFPTIAKLRALRQAWARMAELSGVADPRTRIHAVTSRPMTSTYDLHTNMLRGTVAAFAAGVGGADAITVVPFDEPTGEVSERGRRIARNTSALLIHESHVATVADPAGGAYAVEGLTRDLAEVAWRELGRIESEGAAAFEQRVAEVAARRAAEIAERRRPITGLTEFPNPADRKPQPADSQRRGLRYGAAFEALRDEPVDTGVFLATMGTVAAHTARASFAGNLLAAGGIPVEPAGATDGVHDVLAAYEKAGAGPVVCLAGSDPTYAEWGADLVAALRSAGATRVILAGNPDKVGLDVDDSCAVGVDALAFLTRTREALA